MLSSLSKLITDSFSNTKQFYQRNNARYYFGVKKKAKLTELIETSVSQVKWLIEYTKVFQLKQSNVKITNLIDKHYFYSTSTLLIIMLSSTVTAV